jgi:hypothetical protein
MRQQARSSHGRDADSDNANDHSFTVSLNPLQNTYARSSFRRRWLCVHPPQARNLGKTAGLTVGELADAISARFQTTVELATRPQALVGIAQ